MINLHHIDCMEYMKGVADKHFDLAICDPPYGIGESSRNVISRHHSQKKYKRSEWDSSPPPKEYFTELVRVSKNQIIWGANHFISNLPFDSSCWIFWDKDRYGDFADGELAYTSFNSAVRKFFYTWDGFRKKDFEDRIHHTQKPIALYKWLLQNYATTGDKILDTHCGSGSILIACADMGFDIDACELDKDYYDGAMNRLKTHQRQTKIFEPKEMYSQSKIEL